MANANSTKENKALVDAWAKAQKVLEDAQAKVDEARADVQKHTKAIYTAFGTQPFMVASLGRKYRAIHKTARTNGRGKAIEESYHVLPIPENETTLSF